MKIIGIVAAVCLLAPALSSAYEQGEVVVGERNCRKRDRIVIESPSGYVLAEQYSGSFDKGDQVVGNLTTFGTTKVLVNGSPAELWIDDYMASKDKARRWCFD